MGSLYIMGAMIIAEIGDFNRFDSPDKILVKQVLFIVILQEFVILMLCNIKFIR